jgi:hypothetical protein
MKCNVCSAPSHFFFKKQILEKYDVGFFQCENCGFLQTEKPFWLNESYQEAFTVLDVFLADRAIQFGQVTENVICNYLDTHKTFLDYGGGVGLMTRVMRDKGLDFYRQDKYAKNIFAPRFDIEGVPDVERNFELITCFEVLEHLESPLEELERVFALGKNLLCSTVLQPSASKDDLISWYYLGAVHGQHISFYTEKSMELIAKQFGCRYYTNGYHLHMFTPLEIDNFSFEYHPAFQKTFSYRTQRKLIQFIEKGYTRMFSPHDPKKQLKSLLMDDFHKLEQQIICSDSQGHQH